MKTLLLAVLLVGTCSVEVRARESWQEQGSSQSWQDPPNPYDRNGYDNDGGYSGEPYTWGKSWDRRTPVVKPRPEKKSAPPSKAEPKKDSKK